MNKFTEILTFGKKYTDWQMPLVCNPDEKLHNDTENIKCIRLVLIQQGTGIANLGDQRMAFMAPAIFCGNETESFSATDCRNLSAQAVYFHPWLINSVLNYENIRRNDASLNISTYQDLLWLRPFLDRNPKFCGLLTLGPLAAQKVAKLFAAIFNQYQEQPNPDTWPCRGRSFMIELLFLLERLYSSTETNQADIFPNSTQESDQIILYLYQNYQNKITIPELAEVFHTNRTTLTNLFYQTTGTTIHNYLINLRIRLASFLIRDTLLSLSEITERVGFGDLTHFTRTFRRLTGYTPSDYRQEFCWMLQYYPDFHD